MTFFSIFCALLIEQFRPLRAHNWAHQDIQFFSIRMEKWLNAGQARHGRTAWILTMLTLMIPTLFIYGLCYRMGYFFVLVWNVCVLYLTFGFRRYSHYFSAIQLALDSGDEVAARLVLAEWTGQDVSEMETGELVRTTINRALIATHRHVFGVLFWFLIPLVGPTCALMYRAAEHLAQIWSEPEHMKDELFGRFAVRAFYWIDWIPVRLTAISFAVVGNFEDAVYAWRNFSCLWKDEAMGIILSAGGGAIGVWLGTKNQATSDLSASDVGMSETNPELINNQSDALLSVRTMRSTVGLLWRALLLWMLFLLILSISVWLG